MTPNAISLVAPQLKSSYSIAFPSNLVFYEVDITSFFSFSYSFALFYRISSVTSTNCVFSTTLSLYSSFLSSSELLRKFLVLYYIPFFSK